MGIILDSSILIAAERRGESPAQFIRYISRRFSDQEAAPSAVGLAELVRGIYRTNSTERRIARQKFVRELSEEMNIYPYTETTAMPAGRIHFEQTALGILILMIPGLRVISA